MENTLNLIAGLVEWQGAELHESKRGKMKPIAKGIPGMRFKAAWRAHKALLMSAGVRLAIRERKAAVAAGIPVPELPDTGAQKELSRDADPF